MKEVFPPPLSAAEIEKVVNGGFESGDLSPWEATAGCSVESNPSTAHGGIYSGKIGTTGSLTQTVTGLRPNTTYTLVGYVRMQYAGEYAFIGVRDHGGEPISRVANSTNYMKVALKFVTGATNTAATIFFAKDNGTGEALGDDFSMIEGLNDLDVIDSWLFTQSCFNARDRRLLEILRPEVLHRAGFWWIGTELMERKYEGALENMARLRNMGSNNSTILGAGVSGLWWAPDYETLAPGVDREKATESPSPRKSTIDRLAGRGYLNRDAENQLIYKVEKQIDAGFFDIEFDELCPSEYVIAALHDYAWTRYGRKVFVTANPINLAWGTVDYYMVRFYAFRDVKDNFDGQLNPAAPDKNCWFPGEKDVPFFWFVDFPGIHWMALKNEQYPNALRLIDAWTLAQGNHRPSWSRTFQTRSDPLLAGNVNSGVFNTDANMIKFIRENSVLWHNLEKISPAVFTVANAGKVWMSAFSQPMRTIVHLVNGNYDNEGQTMPTPTGLSLQLSLSKPPTNIWITTPDKLSNARREPLKYTYEAGVAKVEIPELYFHDIIVIEHGPANTMFTPKYEPMRMLLPFPQRANLPAGNTFHITAIQTEGHNSIYDWRVNGIPAGNNEVGTIDHTANYRAPDSVTEPRQITIKAASKDDPSVSMSFGVVVTPSISLPWKESFAADEPGAAPRNWEVVDGRGDWETALDGEEKVLRNSNIMDGIWHSEGDFFGSMGLPAMITAGDQTWKDYVYSVDFKPLCKPAPSYTGRNDISYGVLFLFRYQDYRNYYWCQLCADDTLRFYKCADGHKSEINPPTHCQFPAPGICKNVRIIANGGMFRFEIDGATLRTDEDDSFRSGAIGLGTSFTKNYFRNISASSV